MPTLMNDQVNMLTTNVHKVVATDNIAYVNEIDSINKINEYFREWIRIFTNNFELKKLPKELINQVITNPEIGRQCQMQ